MNARDRKHCIRTIETLRAMRDEHCPYCHEDDDEIGPCESDCYVSEVIMTSEGYLEVWASDCAECGGTGCEDCDDGI